MLSKQDIFPLNIITIHNTIDILCLYMLYTGYCVLLQFNYLLKFSEHFRDIYIYQQSLWLLNGAPFTYYLFAGTGKLLPFKFEKYTLHYYLIF